MTRAVSGLSRQAMVLGQFQAAAAVVEWLRLFPSEDRQKAPRHFVAERFRVAANVHAHGARLGVADCVHVGVGQWGVLLFLLLFLFEPASLFFFGLLCFFRRDERNLNVFRAGDYAGQSVVVGRGNRIELVIVAAGAGDRETQAARG